eukprot:gene24877-33367_t
MALLRTLNIVETDAKSLNTYASYFLFLGSSKSIIGWVGELCDAHDAAKMRKLAADILSNDHPSLYKNNRDKSVSWQKQDIIEIPIIFEDTEVPSSLLEAFLQVLNSTMDEYFSREMKNLRRQKIRNLDLHVGFITKKLDPTYVIEEYPGLTAKQQITHWFEVHPQLVLNPEKNDRVGSSLNRYHIDIVDPDSDADFGTILYIRMGCQWIIWLGMEVSMEDERNLEVYVEQYLSTTTTIESLRTSGTLLECDETEEDDDAPSSIVERPGSPGYFERQGIERTLFKRLFFLGQLSVPEKNSSNTHTQSRSNSNKSKEIFNRVSFTESSHQRLSVPKSEPLASRLFKRDFSRRDFPVVNVTEPDNRSHLSNSNSSSSTAGPSRDLDFYSFDWHANSNHSVTTVTNIQEDECIKVDTTVSSVHAEEPPSVFSLRNVTAEMVAIRSEKNVSFEERLAIINSSAEDPSSLVGWQIEIDEGKLAGVYIVTDVKKTLWGKSTFELNSGQGQGGAVWVPLQRSNKKTGVKFRPLRPIIANTYSAVT